MGKKKHKKDHAKRHEGAGATGAAAPLAGLAATLVRHAGSPEGRQLLAQGLTMAAAAASAALTKQPTPPMAAPEAPPAPPPAPPSPPRAGDAPVPPVPPTPPEGITRTPDPHEIGVALGKAAEQVLGAFLRKKPG